ncbi:serine-aspartate repeat-containing protein C [Astyanax mexicanus]|uniref:Uncharacterized protein n=1 Tax=Astyanax mexicanus TaxID=7994 RepID=A0A8T2L359_ASTMX|nr:serine-aspartate repeat-containing protein C [Astyanax mexicanus]XP_049325050.1 serine-aspartate repeat-containing protein C [Astyanax mexicanus]KAG9263451.1 hypothetical protein AMEX_G23488 [Astyanax mexicanus]
MWTLRTALLMLFIASVFSKPLISEGLRGLKEDSINRDLQKSDSMESNELSDISAEGGSRLPQSVEDSNSDSDSDSDEDDDDDDDDDSDEDTSSTTTSTLPSTTPSPSGPSTTRVIPTAEIITPFPVGPTGSRGDN